MFTGQAREQRPQPVQPVCPIRSGMYENLCSTRWRQRALCTGRGLCPDVCSVKSEKPHESQQRTRRPVAPRASS